MSNDTFTPRLISYRQLAFDSTRCQTLLHVLLEPDEEDDYRHCNYGRHHLVPGRVELRVEIGNPDGGREFLYIGEQNVREEEFVPRYHEYV